MISLSTGMRFLSGGGASISGGGITVPDDPADPADTGGGDTGGDTGGTPPAPALTALPFATTTRWHPAHSTVTLDGDNRVLTASDLNGVAALSATAGTGPQEMTDALGRKFWRFDGAQFLTVADTLLLDSRDMAVFMVGRFHRVRITTDVFSLGSQAAGTALDTNGPALTATRAAQSMPVLQAFSRPPTGNYGPAHTMVTGSQMQVAGMVGRAGVNGGSTLWINGDRIAAAGPLNFTGIAGAEIGRYAHSPGPDGNWGTFDLYEMVVCDTRLTDPEGDSLTTALMTGYNIAPITNQLVLEGDSIMQGTGDVTPALSAGMILTTPGAAHLGPDWRVVNLATSGSRVVDLENRRDVLLGWPDLTVSGQNVLAFEIGRNDISPSFGTTPAQHYANVVAYLTDGVGPAATSVLARGWDLRVMANIASSIDYVDKVTTIRALWRDPAFATDLGTQAGGPYAGQMQVIDTDLITVNGDTVFADADDAGDVTYYAGDSTHPGLAGAIVRATGGDDPTRGIATGLP